MLYDNFVKFLKEYIKRYSVLVLSIFLYLLIFFLRLHQACPPSLVPEGDCRRGGWDIKLDLFPQIRQNLDLRISEFLPSPQGELLSGILLGNKKDLPYDLKLALRDTSTLHIVVVSGQNLTLLAGLFMNMAGLIKRKNAIILSIIAVIFYTILTGGQIPVLRAAIMAIISFTAQLFGRTRDGVWVLIVTGGLMLLVNPIWISDLSFQLSFLATLGVIMVAPILEKRLNFLPELIKLDLAVAIGAQIMVIPIIAQYFHQLSLVGIFANIMVGWTIPIIMILGSLMILLGSFFAILTNIFLTYFIYIVQFFASLPFAWEYIGEQLWIVWIGYYLILLSVMLILNNVKKTDS